MSYKVMKEEGQPDDAPAQQLYDPHPAASPPAPQEAQPGAPGHQPPPYMMTNMADYQPVVAQQQQSNTNVVVANQPQMFPEVAVTERSPPTQPVILILSLVLSVVCGLHLCLPAFVCLIPGLIFAIVGYSYRDNPHERSTAKAFNGVSLCCSVSTLIFYGLAAVITVISLGYYYGVLLPQECSHTCSSYDYNYNSYTHCCY